MHHELFEEHINSSEIENDPDNHPNIPIEELESIDEAAPVSSSLTRRASMGFTHIEDDPNDETILPSNIVTESQTALLNKEDSEHFRTRWGEIQGEFVDDPRNAVQQADTLVSEVIEQLTQMFASAHTSLEDQWKMGNSVSTEDLRKALQRYRIFFNRLVV